MWDFISVLKYKICFLIQTGKNILDHLTKSQNSTRPIPKDDDQIQEGLNEAYLMNTKTVGLNLQIRN